MFKNEESNAYLLELNAKCLASFIDVTPEDSLTDTVECITHQICILFPDEFEGSQFRIDYGGMFIKKEDSSDEFTEDVDFSLEEVIEWVNKLVYCYPVEEN